MDNGTPDGDEPIADEASTENEDALEEVFHRLRLLILSHPVAAQAVFRALVAEGRAFARTAAGQRWAAVLADSPLVRRGRLVWDVATLRTLDDDPQTLVPSAIADAFVKATAADALEPLLSELFEGSFDADR
jgi:hypothetical protein